MNNKFTLAAFAEFCESKPANEEYDYCDFPTCAVSQYAASLGIGPSNAKGWFWARIETHACRAADMATGIGTFGALAKRLREAAS